MTPEQAHTRIADERERLHALFDALSDDIDAQLHAGATLDATDPMVLLKAHVRGAVHLLSMALREAPGEP